MITRCPRPSRHRSTPHGSTRRRARLPLTAAWLGALLFGAGSLGCASTAPAPEEEPLVASVGHLPEMEVNRGTGLQGIETGGYLQELDKRLRSWSRYKLEGRTPEDARKRESIEADIAYLAEQRRFELVEVLEGGPPVNRAVAAMALGFTGDPAVQSPLISALSDRDDQVVANALVGLGLLAMADTPLAEICFLLKTHPAGWTRSNAAFALQKIVGAGATDECAIDSCRGALVDDEPGARSQAALVLGILHDSASVPELGRLLADEVPLVVSSAAHALGTIGSADPAQLGPTARLLSDALDRVPRVTRARLETELTLLAGSNLGSDARAWRNWAFKLP